MCNCLVGDVNNFPNFRYTTKSKFILIKVCAVDLHKIFQMFITNLFYKFIILFKLLKIEYYVMMLLILGLLYVLVLMCRVDI